MGSLSDFFPEAPSSLLAIVQDEKTSGTDGGTPSAPAWNTRTLNTVDYDPGSIITLSTNTFTSSLACHITWSCPAYRANWHKTRLVRVSDSAVISLGTSDFAPSSDFTQNRTFGVSAIEAGVAYRIEHYFSQGVAESLGRPTSQGTEVYTTVSFWS